MFTRFDANKSTKGASKLRRDLINAEIANLRDLLPLPQSTRQRLSQLQLMALVCVYVRKANYFQQVFKRHEISMHHTPTPNIGFSKALSGFLMMLTQNGKLLYISDNAAEYLGHSMEDLLIHGDSVYDIIDKQDHVSIQAELSRCVPPQQSSSSVSSSSAVTTSAATTSSNIVSPPASQLEGEQRMFLCRMNVSRNARRQMRFGDQKVVLVQGHYLSYLPLCSRNEPVFLATCTPIAMPETRECVVQGATNVFTTIHSMDMKFVHIDKNGEFHLGYSRNELQGISWYQILHWDSTREAQTKHRLITQSEQDRSCILLVKMQRRHGDFLWVHTVLQVRDGQDSNQQPAIVCTNQVLSDREAAVMLANAWLYHYYSVQSKIQFGMPFEETPPSQTSAGRINQTSATTTTASATLAAATYYAHFPHHSPPATILQQPPHPHYPHHHPHYPAAHVSYSYHSPVPGIPPPALIGHHHLGNHHHHHHHHTTVQSIGTSGNGGHNQNSNHHNRNNYHQQSQHVQHDSADGGITSGTYANPYTAFAHLEPVDYSPRCPSPPCHNQTDPESPQGKRRAIGRLEPLFIPDVSNDGTADSADRDHLNPELAIGGGEMTVLISALAPSFGSRSRLLSMKSLAVGPAEPPDFMEQWNPSPPWSETAQKVPDIAHQELSPYLTTTPPTPTSATPSSSSIHGPSTTAFSFDWMTEQFVPNGINGIEGDSDANDGPAVSSMNGFQVAPLHHYHHHWAPTELGHLSHLSQRRLVVVPATPAIVDDCPRNETENDTDNKIRS